MRKLRLALLGLVAVLGLSCTAQAQTALPGEWTYSEKTIATMMDIQWSTWADACVAMKMKCRDIIPPRVAYGVLQGQYGAFDLGSRTVLLDIRIFAQEVSVPIMFHEMVHYLQEKRNPLRTGSYSYEENCAAEKEAHTLSYAYSQKAGFAKGDARIKTWAQAAAWYGCIP